MTHFNYTAVIQRTRDKKVIEVFQPCPWHEEDDSSLFWWTEGNMGCDCNLAGFFDDDEDTPCGNERYRVLKFVFPDGSTKHLQDQLY